jgi:ABC-type thiamin/hydroxymethylpyrimidine transport system permease subunit
MDIDALKAGWKKNSGLSAEEQSHFDRLPALLQGKTTDMITVTKRQYERVITVLLGSMVVATLAMPLLTDGFTYPGSPQGFVKMMFYWAKLRTVNHLTLSDSIPERLEQLLTMFRQGLRTEILFIVSLLLGIVFVGRFFYGKGLSGLWAPDVLTAFALSVVFTGALLWFVRKRYRAKIEELKTYLREYRQAQVYGVALIVSTFAWIYGTYL